MKIRDREIVRGVGYVVAEAGTNHAHGDKATRFGRAKYLVEAAHRAGADAIKFQIFVPDEPLFCPVGGDDRRWLRWNDTLLTVDSWMWLAVYARVRGLAFIGSAFQPGGVDIVQEVCDAHKVAVRANETYPWDKIVGKPAIVSMGKWVSIPRKVQYTRLDCCAKYPCSPEDVWFYWLQETDVEEWPVEGYSDHCPGPWMSIKALALGAAIVEKHFVVFDRDKDPDGSHAATPEELALICQARDAWK